MTPILSRAHLAMSPFAPHVSSPLVSVPHIALSLSPISSAMTPSLSRAHFAMSPFALHVPSPLVSVPRIASPLASFSLRLWSRFLILESSKAKRVFHKWRRISRNCCHSRCRRRNCRRTRRLRHFPTDYNASLSYLETRIWPQPAPTRISCSSRDVSRYLRRQCYVTTFI